MKFNTLTSTLVLSLLVVGPQAIGMEIEEKTSLPHVTPTSLTINELLTESCMDLKKVKILVQGAKIGATDEEKALATQAALEIEKNAMERKKSKTPTESITPLNPEEEKAVVSFWNYLNPFYYLGYSTSSSPLSTDPTLTTEVTDTGKIVSQPVEENTTESTTTIINPTEPDGPLYHYKRLMDS